MGSKHLINDPIHGCIIVSDGELKIINSPYFQRLRWVKQLTLVYFVFPSAHHTRYKPRLAINLIKDLNTVLVACF
jgi:HD superfamily phosphohydrolase